jgi:hypothetical protein
MAPPAPRARNGRIRLGVCGGRSFVLSGMPVPVRAGAVCGRADLWPVRGAPRSGRLKQGAALSACCAMAADSGGTPRKGTASLAGRMSGKCSEVLRDEVWGTDVASVCQSFATNSADAAAGQLGSPAAAGRSSGSSGGSKKVTADDFLFGCLLGEGAFARVSARNERASCSRMAWLRARPARVRALPCAPSWRIAVLLYHTWFIMLPRE